MRPRPVSGSRWTHLAILIGVALFLLALIVSAVFVPQLRVLHFLQALIYVAILVLTRKDSPWGFGLAVLVAVVWNALSLFVTHLFQAGAGQLWSLLRTGHVSRPDTLMVMVGGLGHFLLILACLVAFFQLRPGRKAWAQFFAGGFLGVAYLRLIVALAAPH